MINNFLVSLFFLNSLVFNFVLGIDMELLNKDKPVEMVVALVRHGLRTAGEATYPGDPLNGRKSEIWPLGQLQLTNKGKMDQYMLGKWLQQRYNLLLGDRYSSEAVYALSTISDRAVMSGMCLLAGLFPPTGDQIWNSQLLWQPIPVHSYDETAGNLLNSHDHVNCPNYWKEYALMNKSKEYMDLFEKSKDVREYIYNNTGLMMKDYQELNYLYDYIEKQVDENITIPEWARNIFPEPWLSASMPFFVVPTFNEPLKRLFMGPFLKNLLNLFQEKSSGKSERKFYLLSGHDYNISNLLNLLGAFNWLIPPYSSALLIELRKDYYNNYFVTIFFKNSTEEAYPIKVNGCDPTCPLDSFHSLLLPYMVEDWYQECRSSSTTSLLMKGIGPLAILLSSATLLV